MKKLKKAYKNWTLSTKDGEIADKSVYYIDEDSIAKEEKYDGFYAVCTSLDDHAEAIVKVNQRR